MLLVLDVETQKSLSQVKEKDPRQLKASFTGVLVKDKSKEQYLGFWENELDKLWPILERADLVVGFNLIAFDYPVLSFYYPGQLAKLPTLDILQQFKEQAGHRISLDNIAQPTLGMAKTGSGLKAIELYRQGKLAELKKYCLKDVEITYQIYRHGQKFGFLNYRDKWNNIRKVKVNFSRPVKQTEVQMTLGG